MNQLFVLVERTRYLDVFPLVLLGFRLTVQQVFLVGGLQNVRISSVNNRSHINLGIGPVWLRLSFRCRKSRRSSWDGCRSLCRGVYGLRRPTSLCKQT